MGPLRTITVAVPATIKSSEHFSRDAIPLLFSAAKLAEKKEQQSHASSEKNPSAPF